MFHYLDGGADDEWTLRRNTAAFDDYQLVPEPLVDISRIDFGTRVLRTKAGSGRWPGAIANPYPPGARRTGSASVRRPVRVGKARAGRVGRKGAGERIPSRQATPDPTRSGDGQRHGPEAVGRVATAPARWPERGHAAAAERGEGVGLDTGAGVPAALRGPSISDNKEVHVAAVTPPQ